jgi:hypothetical protein
MSRGRAAQFDLYAALQERGIDVREEVRLPACSPRSRSGHFVVDLAVYYRGTLVAVCECKAWKRALTGRQLENYEGCGVPYIVAGSDNFTESLMWLSEWGKGRAPK